MYSPTLMNQKGIMCFLYVYEISYVIMSSMNILGNGMFILEMIRVENVLMM